MLRLLKSILARDVRWWLKLISLIGMITLVVYSSVLSMHQHQQRRDAIFGVPRRYTGLDLEGLNTTNEASSASHLRSSTGATMTIYQSGDGDVIIMDNGTDAMFTIPETSSTSTTTSSPTTEPPDDLEFRIKAQNVCKSDPDMDIVLAILVTSAPGHHVERDTIRQTWGHFALRKDLRIAFVVGLSEDQKTNQRIAKESLYFGDIIQLSFVDSYYNLTSKVMSMLRWASRYCSSPQFLLKTDDDMFINVPVLLDFLKSHANVSSVIYGRIASQWKPARSKKSKWFVSRTEWKAKFYPNFVTGPAYLMTSDCVPKLLAASQGEAQLKLEDVFTTGILAEKAGIRREGVKKFANVRPKVNDTCALSKIISAHAIKRSEMFDIWKRLQDPNGKRCKA